jgi:predicted O-methyltransferase YrrM
MSNKIYQRIKAKLKQVLLDIFDDQEAEKARQIGIDLQAAESRLNEVLRSLDRRPFDYARDSIHWVLGAAVGQRFAPRRILELGTSKGEFTDILARLYPSAEICTVDLPPDDPILQEFLAGRKRHRIAAALEARAGSLDHPNVHFIETNSLFLLEKVSGPFDFIWVDAGHRFPEVAWDLAHAYHLCRPGGIIMADDVTLDPSYESGTLGPDSSIVLQYLAIRAPIMLQYFLKRRHMKFFAKPRSSECVAWMDKTVALIGDHQRSEFASGD